jgi:hypothetical protein
VTYTLDKKPGGQCTSFITIMDNELVEFNRLRGRSGRVRGAVSKNILYNTAASPDFVSCLEVAERDHHYLKIESWKGG